VAVVVGEGFEMAVEGAFEVVEIADYGERGWTRWKILEVSGLEEKLEKEKENDIEKRVR